MNKRQTLIDYTSSLTKLKDIGGGKQAGRCPIHEEKTASFNIYANGDQATCFGCGFQGDVFDLYIALNGGTFLDAKKNFGHRAIYTPKILNEAEYKPAKKKEIYLKCREALINGKKFTVIIKGRRYSSEAFIWLCLKDNNNKMKFIYQLIQEIINPIAGDLFWRYCDDQIYLFNYASWDVEI